MATGRLFHAAFVGPLAGPGADEAERWSHDVLSGSNHPQNQGS
ncbi:hypothetical protein ACFYZ0_12800 [Streptomyces sp. NPDC001708]